MTGREIEVRTGITSPMPREAAPESIVRSDGEDLSPGEIWDVLRRRRSTILITVVFMLAAAGIYSWVTTPVWRASTILRMTERDPSTPNSLDALLLLQTRGSEIETDMRILRTRPIAEEVVDSLDLNLRVTRPAGVSRADLIFGFRFDRSTPRARYHAQRIDSDVWVVEGENAAEYPARRVRTGERVDVPGGFLVLGGDLERGGGPGTRRFDGSSVRLETVPFQEAVRDLSDRLQVVRPDRDANLVELIYEGTDRDLVQRIPNAVANAFMAQRRVVQKTEVRSTVAFLREQSELLRAQLEAAESELQGFREGRQIVALGAEAEEHVRRLADLESQRAQLDAERTALANLLRSVEEADAARPDYRKLLAFPTFLGNEAIADILGALTAAEGQRTELLKGLTPKHPDVEAVTVQIEQLELQLAAIGRNYLSALNDQLASLDSVLARFAQQLEEIPAREVQFGRLERRSRLLSELYTLLQTRLKEAEIAEAVEDPRVRIVETAIRPDRPIQPRPVRALALAGVFGIVLGVGLALGREFMDSRIHATEDVEEDLGLAAIGRIPTLQLGNGRTRGPATLVTLTSATSPGAEAFRTLRTNVRFVRGGAGSREMVVTSPGPREGKSMTAANLAGAMAQQGMRSLLVDADMRRAVQHLRFGASREPGLSDVLTRSATLEQCVRATQLECLDLLTAGSPAPNPSELLGSPRLSELLQEIRERYDVVVIDSPPILAVTDAAVLGQKVEGVILVVRADQTHRQAAAGAVAQLRRVGATILGVVLNDARAAHAYGYYRRYYGAEEERSGLRRLLGSLGHSHRST